MADPARKLMTADEFLAFDGETDARYELVDGVVVAMAPTTDAHGTIVGNAWGEIDRRLASRPPCRGVIEAGIRLGDYNHYKADLAATCAEPDRSPLVREPFLVVEVLSPRTASFDLTVKLPAYLALASVREVWMVDSRERRVQVWRRVSEGWAEDPPLTGQARRSRSASSTGTPGSERPGSRPRPTLLPRRQPDRVRPVPGRRRLLLPLELAQHGGVVV